MQHFSHSNYHVQSDSQSKLWSSARGWCRCARILLTRCYNSWPVAQKQKQKRHKYTNATKHKQAIKKLTKNEILSVVVMMWKWHRLRKHELDHSRAALEETRTWLNYSHMPVFNQTMHGHVVWKADHLLCIFITVSAPSTHSERNSKLLNVSIAENNPGEFNFLNPLYTGQSCRTCSAVCFVHTRIATKQIDKYSSDYSVSCALSCDE